MAFLAGIPSAVKAESLSEPPDSTESELGAAVGNT